MNWDSFIYLKKGVLYAKTGCRKAPSSPSWWRALGQERINNSPERRKPLLASGVPWPCSKPLPLTWPL